MKKLILLLVAVFSFIACEGPMGPEGPQGLPGASTEWYIYNPTVYSNQWKLQTDADGLNAHYYCDVPVSDLDWDIYKEGLIKLYVFLDPNNTDAGMIEMPDIYPLQDTSSFKEYTVICGAILYEGGITFTVRYTDFADDVLPPDMKFHVVLVY